MKFTRKALRNFWIAEAIVIAMSFAAFLAETFAGTLRAHANVASPNVAHVSVEPERMTFDGIVTDMHAPLKAPEVPNPKQAYADALAAIRHVAPQTIVGSYLSSRMVRDPSQLGAFPAECLPPRYFEESEFSADGPTGEPGRFVDYTQPVARAKLVRLITNEAVNRGLPVLFTDNWSHPDTGGITTPFSVTLDYMGELRAALKVRGVRLYCNLALAIGADIPDSDIARLAANCDGLTLEMSCVPNVGSDPAAIERMTAHYRTLLGKGVRVIFLPVVPNGTKEQVDAESRYLAGLAIAVQFDGNHPTVAYPVFHPNPDWCWWPESLGKPRESRPKQDGTTLTRRFERGTIVADCLNRTVSLN